MKIKIIKIERFSNSDIQSGIQDTTISVQFLEVYCCIVTCIVECISINYFDTQSVLKILPVNLG